MWHQASLIRVPFFLAVLGTLGSLVAYGHQGHQAQKHPGPEVSTPMTKKSEGDAIKLIRQDYQRRIEPIFKKSCMDCHSSQTRYPWYYKIPGIKQMMDSDIEEARHHLDFSGGYPFKSHASPIEDLDAIAKSIQGGSMPPFSYRLMHANAALTDAEKKAIFDWVEKSKKTAQPINSQLQ